MKDIHIWYAFEGAMHFIWGKRNEYRQCFCTWGQV